MVFGRRIHDQNFVMTKLPELAAWIVFAQEKGAKDRPSAGIWTVLTATPLLPVLAIFVLFYFMLLRPEKRKRTNLAQMLDNLQKNDRIITIGGIYGTVVNAPKGSAEITIRVDENSNSRVRILRSAVSRVLTGEESTESKTDE